MLRSFVLLLLTACCCISSADEMQQAKDSRLLLRAYSRWQALKDHRFSEVLQMELPVPEHAEELDARGLEFLTKTSEHVMIVDFCVASARVFEGYGKISMRVKAEPINDTRATEAVESITTSYWKWHEDDWFMAGPVLREWSENESRVLDLETTVGKGPVRLCKS